MSSAGPWGELLEALAEVLENDFMVALDVRGQRLRDAFAAVSSLPPPTAAPALLETACLNEGHVAGGDCGDGVRAGKPCEICEALSSPAPAQPVGEASEEEVEKEMWALRAKCGFVVGEAMTPKEYDAFWLKLARAVLSRYGRLPGRAG